MMSNIWKSVFCIGTGNEAASAGHTSGRIISEGEETIQLAIQSRQSSISIQIWKEYTDQIEISIINPSGVRVGPVPEILGPHRFRIGQTEILLYYGEPSPYSISQGNLYRSTSGRKLSDRRNMENCSKCREDCDRTI